MGFSTDTKARGWMITCHEQNFINAGLTEEDYKKPEFLADFLKDMWEKSGTGRTAAVSVCISEKGLYHVHVAAYGNTTTLHKVSKVFHNSHVEPQMGGKDSLRKYMEKESPYDEKGEIVLCTLGMENVKDKQGKRSDLESIEEMLEQGMNPREIMEESFSYRRYEKDIRSAYAERRIKETPLIKDMTCEYIFGESGTGKTNVYKELAEQEGEENIYFLSDYQNGGFDNYMLNGAPHILFMDEFKGQMKYSTLLSILDVYSRAQIHSRYSNCFALWDRVIITSVFSPEAVYKLMVKKKRREKDPMEQFIRRLTTITYKYVENGEYKSFSISAAAYGDDELFKKALLINRLMKKPIDDDHSKYIRIGLHGALVRKTSLDELFGTRGKGGGL